MKALLFLGTSLVGAQYIQDAIAPLGLRPIFLLNIKDYAGNPKNAIKRCEYYEADVNSLPDLMRAIKQHQFIKEVVAVTSLLDETLHHARQLADIFNIIGPDHAVSKLVAKHIVYQIIPEFSPPTFVFDLIELSNDELAYFFSKFSNTKTTYFLLKPSISSGGVGAAIIKPTISVNEIHEIILSSPIKAMHSSKWLIQPYSNAPLYSLEGYVDNDKVFFLGYSKRVRKQLREYTNEFPVDGSLDREVRKKCEYVVTALVTRSRYHYGYFHCEFLIERDAVYLIDANIGRIAGAAIVQQIAVTYDKQPAEILRHVFDLGVFKAKNTPDFKYKKISDRKTLGIKYYLPKSAKIIDYLLPHEMSSYHTAICDFEQFARGSNDENQVSWVGYIAGIEENVRLTLNQLKIKTDLGILQPNFMNSY